MKLWWAGLAERERRLLIAAAIVIGVFLWWLALLRPLGAARDELSARLPEVRAKAAASEAAIPQIRAGASAATQPRVGQSLLALADASARNAGLSGALDRVEPQGDAEVRVWLKDADFDALAAWAEQLSAEGVSISEWSVDRALAPGVVNARLTLKDAP
jgi:general secretion pathway protein M